jgi:hypothetical protein
MIRLRAGRPGFDSRQGRGFFFSSSLRPHRLWVPSSFLSDGYKAAAAWSWPPRLIMRGAILPLPYYVFMASVCKRIPVNTRCGAWVRRVSIMTLKMRTKRKTGRPPDYAFLLCTSVRRTHNNAPRRHLTQILRNEQIKIWKIFTVVKIQVEVFWAVTPCGVVVGYQRLRGPCCLHLLGCDAL